MTTVYDTAAALADTIDQLTWTIAEEPGDGLHLAVQAREQLDTLTAALDYPVRAATILTTVLHLYRHRLSPDILRTIVAVWDQAPGTRNRAVPGTPGCESDNAEPGPRALLRRHTIPAHPALITSADPGGLVTCCHVLMPIRNAG